VAPLQNFQLGTEIFGSNMSWQEIEQIIQAVFLEPDRYTKKIRRGEFVRIMYSGINLLRLKLNESKRPSRGHPEMLLD
jgi:hypothetical protein